MEQIQNFLTEYSEGIEILLTFGGFFLVGWLVARFMRKTVDKNANSINIDQDVTKKIRKKSIRMIRMGKYCPQHNWYYRTDLDQYGNKTTYNFCDICKKRPSQI